MISGMWVQYHNQIANGIAGMIIVRRIIHHLTLKNNNNVHNVTMSTATIGAPQALHTHGNAIYQAELPLGCGTLFILGV